MAGIRDFRGDPPCRVEPSPLGAEHGQAMAVRFHADMPLFRMTKPPKLHALTSSLFIPSLDSGGQAWGGRVCGVDVSEPSRLRLSQEGFREEVTRPRMARIL